MICKECGKQFKTIAVIGGKTRNLCNRKRCFECSPFGKHNNRRVGTKPGDMHPCLLCGNSTPLRRKLCASCRVAVYRAKLKKRLLSEFGDTCFKCGHVYHYTVMEFHHLDKRGKSFAISGSTVSYKKMKAEASKCIVLCANCHREEHARQSVVAQYIESLPQ